MSIIFTIFNNTKYKNFKYQIIAIYSNWDLDISPLLGIEYFLENV